MYSSRVKQAIEDAKENSVCQSRDELRRFEKAHADLSPR